MVVKWTGYTGTGRRNVAGTLKTGLIRTGLCGDEAQTASWFLKTSESLSSTVMLGTSKRPSWEVDGCWGLL